MGGSLSVRNIVVLGASVGAIGSFTATLVMLGANPKFIASLVVFEVLMIVTIAVAAYWHSFERRARRWAAFAFLQAGLAVVFAVSAGQSIKVGTGLGIGREVFDSEPTEHLLFGFFEVVADGPWQLEAVLLVVAAMMLFWAYRLLAESPNRGSERLPPKQTLSDIRRRLLTARFRQDCVRLLHETEQVLRENPDNTEGAELKMLIEQAIARLPVTDSVMRRPLNEAIRSGSLHAMVLGVSIWLLVGWILVSTIP